MDPTRLRLSGINCYDDLDLDLSALPPGLVAVSGPNGSGKTTLLEALLPVPLDLAFPSRSGSLYRRVGASRTNVIETTLRHDGSDWRFRIVIDPGTGKSGERVDAFLFRDGVPVDGTEKGDQGAYKRAVATFFPPTSLLYASIFSLQNGKGNLLDATKAERRALFAKLLRLEEDEALAARAAARVAKLDEVIGAADGALEALRAELAQVGDDEARLEALRASVATAAEQVRTASAARETATSRAATLRAAADRAEAEVARHAKRIGEIEALLRTRRARVEQLEAEVRAAASAEAGLPALREEAEGLAEARREETEATAEKTRQGERWTAAAARRKELRSRLEAAAGDSVEARRVAKAEAERKLAEAEALVVGLDDALARHELAKTEAARLVGELRKAEAEVGGLAAAKARLEEAERASKLVDEVPCHARTIIGRTEDHPKSYAANYECGSCRLLGSAADAKRRLPELRAAVEEAEAKALAATAARAASEVARSEEVEASRAVDRLRSEERRLPDLRAAASRAGEDLERAVRAAAEKVEAGEALAEVNREIATIEADGAEAKDRLERATARVLALVEVERRLRVAETAVAGVPALRRSLGDAKADLETTERQLADEREATPPSAEAAVAAARTAEEERDLARAREETASAALRSAEGDVARLEGRLAELERRRGVLAASSEVREKLARRRAAAALVARGFGREGTQALAIDASGPRVSELANELLRETFGGRFAVRFITTRLSADRKKLNEVFDVEVLDGRSGGAVREPGDLSGGERVIVSEAIKLAVAVYNAERNGLAVRVLYRDECDGALDDEAAAAYAPMLRRALDLGGFERCFFISHRPDVVAQADAVLRTGGGTVRVEVR